jgi:hypothetical protein
VEICNYKTKKTRTDSGKEERKGAAGQREETLKRRHRPGDSALLERKRFHGCLD